MGDSEKFENKIIGKNFLLGKYYDGKEQARKNAKKNKKFTSINIFIKNPRFASFSKSKIRYAILISNINLHTFYLSTNYGRPMSLP